MVEEQEKAEEQSLLTFEEYTGTFEPGTFPPFDFSLFSYMKIHQR